MSDRTPSAARGLIKCDGGPYCQASPHMHGCFADKGDCDHPSEHPAAHKGSEGARVGHAPDSGNAGDERPVQPAAPSGTSSAAQGQECDCIACRGELRDPPAKRPSRWVYRDLFRLKLLGKEWLLELRWRRV